MFIFKKKQAVDTEVTTAPRNQNQYDNHPSAGAALQKEHLYGSDRFHLSKNTPDSRIGMSQTPAHNRPHPTGDQEYRMESANTISERYQE